MKAATKKGYHHGNLRAALIQAGLELIAEKGVRALTLREIGARVGVSRMAAYRHFADKATLLAAIRRAGFEMFATALEDGRANAPAEFAARLTAMGIAYVRFARDHPAYFEVMFSSPPAAEPGEESKAEERAFQILEETIVEGQAKGELRQGNSRVTACALWALVHGIGALQLDELKMTENSQPDDFVAACSRLLFDGILATKK